MKRVLLDSCVDQRLARCLPDYDVVHARELSWERLQNGQLVRAAAQQFDILITVDKNMRHQTQLVGIGLAVAVLDVRRNRLDQLLPLVPRLIEALSTAVPGEYHVVQYD